MNDLHVKIRFGQHGCRALTFALAMLSCNARNNPECRSSHSNNAFQTNVFPADTRLNIFGLDFG